MDQLTLALSRRRDPDTSKVAANSLTEHLTHLEFLVVEMLKAVGARGATTEELADLLNMDRVTVSPRLRPLADKSMVVASDDRRIGRSGRASIVWKLK